MSVYTPGHKHTYVYMYYNLHFIVSYINSFIIRI